MIHGAHIIIYSKDAEADRAFFRDVLRYESADAGHGWLIFALPPAEVAVHPSETNDVHELYFMCDDVRAFITEMQEKKVKCAPIEEQRWGFWKCRDRLRAQGYGWNHKRIWRVYCQLRLNLPRRTRRRSRATSHSGRLSRAV